MRTVGELKEIGAKSPDANSQKPIVYVSIYKQSFLIYFIHMLSLCSDPWAM